MEIRSIIFFLMISRMVKWKIEVEMKKNHNSLQNFFSLLHSQFKKISEIKKKKPIKKVH